MIQAMRPTKEWIDVIRPQGIEKYGEKQWEDWEILIEICMQQESWRHPSSIVHNDDSANYHWMWGRDDPLFDMREVNWVVLNSDVGTKYQHMFPQYAILLI